MTDPKRERRENALAEILALDPQLWADLGPRMSCHEAEAFAELMCAENKPDVADWLVTAHSEGDNEHYSWHLTARAGEGVFSARGANHH
jgi:hypothetical protein